MFISILCSDKNHPVNQHLRLWAKTHSNKHKIELVSAASDLSGGDILFLISCTEIISADTRVGYGATLLIHASDLPSGGGWSPLVWQILEGKEQVVICLLEAEDKVDSGRIWQKYTLQIPKSLLWDEINELLFKAEIQLMNFAVENYGVVVPTDQEKGIKRTYYPRRTANDSEIDPEKSLMSQFDLIRISDPIRYPCFFELYGKKYKLTLERADD
ncbi:UDP-glucuronic acid dehydrogenase [Gammaproteobacteria bacterium]|nr:UDP-glucuronic acid dehydrogenase [Gammaproteobacteria bacterium]